MPAARSRLPLPPNSWPRPTVLAAALALGLAFAAPAAAVPLFLEVDDAQSTIGGSPLSGTITLELGALPPVGSNTALDVVALALTGGGFSIGLDGSLANPGLGVLFPDGSFLIPALHLSVDGADLTVTNVAGSLAPDAACAGELCLLADLTVDPPTGGMIGVSIVAAVPEPGRLAVFLMSGLAWAAASGRRS